MRLFQKKKDSTGLLAVDLGGDGVRVVHALRPVGSMPSVDLAMFFPSSGAVTGSQLEKIGKEVKASGFRCSTLLGGGEYQILSVDAPNVPQEELKTAIRWRLKDMLDFHVDDATIDVLEVPGDKNAAGRGNAMFAVAARNQVVQQRQTLFEEAKIPLGVIDIPEMAQRNLSSLIQPEGRGIAMLYFDASGGLLTVTYEGELYLSRRIEVPVSSLASDSLDQRSAFHDRITLELQRSLDHFDRQYHFITMSKLVLGPLPENVQGLQDYLASNLYMQVEALDLASAVDLSRVPEVQSREGQHRFFLAIGAALRVEEKAL